MRAKYEIKAQKELEADGWTVDNKAGMGRFAKNRNFWNLFDLVAVKRGEPLRWISIKGHNSSLQSHEQIISDFFLPPGNRKELWRWPKNKRKKAWIKLVLPKSAGLVSSALRRSSPPLLDRSEPG
jgi:hypothetical protein